MKSKKINTFRAFRNRNYTLFFFGQSVSRIGTWMQMTGVSWLIYSATHSTFMLGLSVFASQFPAFLFSIYGGIIADRYNRAKILLITQSAAMVQSILLAILTLANHYAIWEILSLSVLLGVINAFDVPARQPLVHEMVNNKEDLPNALALNSSMNNLARLIGPALSGLILVKFGAGICFLLNALSFVAVLVSLLLMKLPPYMAPTVKKKIRSELVEGFVYLKNTPALSIILLLLTVLSLLVFPYDTLMPVFAREVFKGNAATYGYISSFSGLGAVAGTIFLASLKPGVNLKMVLLINLLIFGIALMCFSHLVYFPMAMVFAVIAGFTSMTLTTISITLIQVHSDAAMRGRVMSYMAMAIFGMLPLGSLLIGIVSHAVGSPNAILGQGIMAILVAASFFGFLRKEPLNEKEKEEFAEAESEIINKI